MVQSDHLSEMRETILARESILGFGQCLAEIFDVFQLNLDSFLNCLPNSFIDFSISYLKVCTAQERALLPRDTIGLILDL